MSNIFINGTGLATCDNCSWVGNAEDCVIVHDAQERLDSGGTVPCGECPNCGCLAYEENIGENKRGRAGELHDVLAEIIADIIKLHAHDTEPRQIIWPAFEKAVLLLATIKKVKEPTPPTGFELAARAHGWDRQTQYTWPVYCDANGVTTAEIGARGAGWTHGGDDPGIIYHTEDFDGPQVAEAWSVAGQGRGVYRSWEDCCENQSIDLTEIENELS